MIRSFVFVCFGGRRFTSLFQENVSLKRAVSNFHVFDTRKLRSFGYVGNRTIYAKPSEHKLPVNRPSRRGWCEEKAGIKRIEWRGGPDRVPPRPFQQRSDPSSRSLFTG